jgi:hypothetical protein
MITNANAFAVALIAGITAHTQPQPLVVAGMPGHSAARFRAAAVPFDLLSRARASGPSLKQKLLVNKTLRAWREPPYRRDLFVTRASMLLG